MNNGDMPAMPELTRSVDDRNNDGVFHHESSGGLTKREYIAALAMQGILGNAYWNEYGDYRPGDVAGSAKEYADALLAALEQN